MFASAVTVLASLIALPMAWLTERTDLPGRSVVRVLSALPLAVPTYVGAMVAISAFGPGGLLEDAIGRGLPGSIYGFWGATAVLGLLTYPYLLLTVRPAVASLDHRLEDASRGFGYGRWTTFRRVVIPQLRPALSSGGLVVALYALADFGAPSLMRFDSFTRVLFIRYESTFDRTGAAALAAVLAVIALSIVAFDVLSRGRRRYDPIRANGTPKAPPIQLGRWRWPALAFVAGVLTLALALPVGVLGYWLVRGLSAGEAVAGIWDATRDTLVTALLAAGLTALAALPVALLAVRHARFALTRPIEVLSYVGYALPGLVVALALVFAGINFGPLYQSLAMLLVAYVLLFLPLAIGATRVSLLQIRPSVEEAARGPRTVAAERAADRDGAVDAAGDDRGGRAGLPHDDQGAAGDADPRPDRLRQPGGPGVERLERGVLRARRAAGADAAAALVDSARAARDQRAATMSKLALRANGLRASFDGVEAVSDLTLDVHEGELLAILGSSGCGKTTSLRLIAGFEAPSAGSLELGGELVADARRLVPPERRGVGMVFQDYALFPHMTVLENVEYGLRNVDRKRDLALEALTITGLAHLGGRRVHELSGGEQQRVALARAIAPRPKLLLLDEPFSNLDPSLRTQVREELREIVRETGITTILVTHDQEEALSIADRVAFISRGRIVQIGTPEELYLRPRSVEVAEFIGDANVLYGEVDGGSVRTPFGSFEAGGAGEGASRAAVVIRPEDLEVSEVGAPATIVHREYYGHDQVLRVELEDGTPARVRLGSRERHEAGQQVALRLLEPPLILAAD